MGSILVVAAHPDDEVLGCGGYIALRARAGDEVSVIFLSDGVSSRDVSEERSLIEVRREAAKSAAKILGVTSLTFGDLPDNKLDAVPLLEVIKVVEKAIAISKPHVILTHFGGDLNIDHRIANQAVVTACRPVSNQIVKQVMFFEIPSSTEWQIPIDEEAFVPNWFEDISTTLKIKTAALAAYSMEIRDWPHPRSIRAIEHLAHWRGATCGVDAAEAFMLGRRSP
jgi:LmbE family N-acetylglucosaminyl deacetylase